MKLALAWLLGTIMAAGMAYAYDSYRPSLPYTEPHHEFTSQSGADCVAWQFPTGHYIVICEGMVPALWVPEQKCGLKL